MKEFVYLVYEHDNKFDCEILHLICRTLDQLIRKELVYDPEDINSE